MALLGLLSLHAIAAPVGVCAQPREGHHAGGSAGVEHDMAVTSATHGQMQLEASAPSPASAGGNTAGPVHETDSMPMNCMVLAACGAPAVGSVVAESGLVPLGRIVRSSTVVAQRPAAVVLGLLTPPPKI